MQDKTISIVTRMVTAFSTTGSPVGAGTVLKPPGAASGAILNSVKNSASLFAGKFPMKAFANGGIENHVAQFAKAGAMRLWAEPETGGEAYIPLAKSKRSRSLEILEEVARIFGFGLHNIKMADGGTLNQPIGAASTVPSASSKGPDVNFHVHPSQGLSEQQIGESALKELYWQLSSR